MSATLFGLQQGIFYMHHPTDRIGHTTAFVIPVVEQRLKQEIAQLVDDPLMDGWIKGFDMHIQSNLLWYTFVADANFGRGQHFRPKQKQFVCLGGGGGGGGGVVVVLEKTGFSLRHSC